MSMRRAMSDACRAYRAAERKDAKLPSVASRCKVEADGEISLVWAGVALKGGEAHLNLMLEKLGLRKVRVTRNILNAAAGEFVIDFYTPSYCDPGSEAYHSM